MFTRILLHNCAFQQFGRRSIVKATKEQIASTDHIWNIIEQNQIKSPKDWKIVRNEFLNSHRLITPNNVDAMTVGICTSKQKFDLALSYLDFLKEENIKINLATIGKYFKLLYIKQSVDNSATVDQERIIRLYKEIRQTYPILDTTTLESAIEALCLTKEWKLSLDLLNEIKLTSAPSSHAYNVVIAAAFEKNDIELAWKLLHDLLENNRLLHSQIFNSYFKRLANKPNLRSEVEKFFNFLQQNNLRIDWSSIDAAATSLKQLQLKVSLTSVDHRGLCKTCHKKLRTFELSEHEFNILKTKIVQNVIVGRDLYNKTTKEELDLFKDFIANLPKVDVIVDGLNVAFSAGVQQSPFVTSGLVAAVVSHFVKQNKKVLVLGRKHMHRWPKENWGYIVQNSAIFLTENLSQDDPYLLYCALQSGRDTIIVTRDLMRGHKFLLKEMQLRLLFDRWLAQRQYMLVRVQGNEVPLFKKPVPYSFIAQRNEDFWHIPYNTGASSISEMKWLCVKL